MKMNRETVTAMYEKAFEQSAKLADKRAKGLNPEILLEETKRIDSLIKTAMEFDPLTTKNSQSDRISF